MAGKKGQKKRFWSDEEKRSICLQTRVPGVSVAQVARRYAMNSNLIFTWLRDSRFAPIEDETPSDPEESNLFLPVEITEFAAEPAPGDGLVETPRPAGSCVLVQRIDITLTDGRRILVEGPTALSAVVGLVKGLMA